MNRQEWLAIRRADDTRVLPKQTPRTPRVRGRVPISTFSSLKKRMRYLKRRGVEL